MGTTIEVTEIYVEEEMQPKGVNVVLCLPLDRWDEIYICK